MKTVLINNQKHLSFIDENMKQYQKQKKLNDMYNVIFDKSNINKVSIIPTGSGKTFNIAKYMMNHIYDKKAYTNELLLVSTMSNNLIGDLVQEFCKNLEISKKVNDKALLKSIIETKDSKTLLFKHFNILILNANNGLNLEELQQAKVIITNPTYFFTQGHTAKYHKAIKYIRDYLKEQNKKIKIVCDEFDKFFLFGQVCINLNHYESIDLCSKEKIQYEKATTCFNYKKKDYMTKCNFEDLTPPFDEIKDDYLYLPKESYKKRMAEKEGIKYFINSVGNNKTNETHDFKDELLDKLEMSKSYLVDENRKGTPFNTEYILKRVNEVTLYKLPYESIHWNNEVINDFLKSQETIFIITEKLQLYQNLEGEEGEKLQLFDTRQDFINWIKEKVILPDNEYNTSFINDWYKYHGHLQGCGENLYIHQMILRKKPFCFNNATKYYLTATPKNLDLMGYELIYHDIPGACQLKEIDFFNFQSQENCKSKMAWIMQVLKDWLDYKAFFVINKKDKIDKFIKDNLVNSKLNNIEIVEEGKIINIGKSASNEELNEKNVVFTYQKGTETQGTNYREFLLMGQDYHVKVALLERIITFKKNNEIELLINDYSAAGLQELIQSTSRIKRGNYKYKAYFNFLDFENEDQTKNLNDVKKQLESEGIKVNEYNIPDIKRQNDFIEVAEEILKCINDKNLLINEGEKININEFSYEKFKSTKKTKKSNNLDSRQKYNHSDIINTYLNLWIKHKKDTLIIPELTKMYNVSNRQFKRMKNKYFEYIDAFKEKYIETMADESQQLKLLQNNNHHITEINEIRYNEKERRKLLNQIKNGEDF